MPMPSQSSLSSHESSSVGRRNSGGGGKLRNSFRMASSGGLATSTRGSKEQLSQCLTLPNIMSHAIQQHQQYQYRRGSSDSFKKMRTSREGLASSSIEHYEHLHQQPRRNSLRRSSCQSAHHLIRKSSGEPSHTSSSSSKRVSGFGVRSATTNNNQNVEWDEITAASSVKATRLTRPSLTLSPLILLPLSSDEPSRDDKDEKQQEKVKTKPTLLEQPSLDGGVAPGVVALTSSSSMQPKEEEQQHQAEQAKPVHPASHSPRSQTNPINSITSTTQEPQCNVPVSNSKQSATSTTNEQQQLPFTSWIGSKPLLSEQGDEYETVIKSDDRTDIDKSSRVEDGEDEAATDHNEKAENKQDDEKDEFVDTATTGTTADAESESDTNESPKKSWSEGFINSCPTWMSFFLPNVQVNIIEDPSTKNKINYPIKNVCFSTQEDIISYEVTPDDIKHSWISINIPRTLHNIQMISAHRGIKVSYSSIAANTLGKTTMVHIEPTNLIDCMEQSRDRYVQAVLREQERQRTEGEYEENNGMLDVDKLGKVASKYSQWSVELALSSWWLER